MNSPQEPTGVACVFPGQGSQKKGMGQGLFERFGDLCDRADEILGFSIAELCLNNPKGMLRFTQFTQPALYVVNALTWLDRQEREPPPDYLAGHSLGEYNALFAAGCFDFETGLHLVKYRGALMSEATEGGMAAVLGLEVDRVREVLEGQGATTVDIANLNLATQLVLSGPKMELERLIKPMEEAGAKKCLMLNVSAAFHSRYMEPTAVAFEEFLKNYSFVPPQLPVIANTTAKPYEGGEVSRYLVDQIRSSVRWAETMDYLLDHGVTACEELGPGKVLKKLWGLASGEISSPAHGTPRVVSIDTSSAAHLGDASFRQDYGTKLAYVAGAPTRGVRTAEFVIGLGKAGLVTYLDTFTAGSDTGVRDLEKVVRQLGASGPFGVSLHQDPAQNSAEGGSVEEQAVEAALLQGVRCAEAVGYRTITPALVRFRYKGAHRDAAGRPVVPHRLMALVNRLSLASQFLRPAPEKLVAALVGLGHLTAEEGEIARQHPLASDLAAMSGTGEGAEMSTLLPALQRLRGQLVGEEAQVRVGAGGAIGTPEAVACAFMLGADFVQTSAVNLCSREAGTSDAVKALLAGLEVGDTTAVPAVDGFSLGAKVQVVKKGSFFAPRAQKLYEIFRFYDSLEAIETAERKKIEEKYFKRSFDTIWEELRGARPQETASADARYKMALVFSWYLEASLRWAMAGTMGEKVNFQVPCDESMAAFNLYAAGTELENGSARSAVTLGERLMVDGARFLDGQLGRLKSG